VETFNDRNKNSVNIANYPAIVGESISIRIRGIDAPEIRAKCTLEKTKAIRTRDYLRATLASEEVIKLHSVERGKYFRLVANVVVDGVDISELMIEKQLARSYDGKTKKSINHYIAFSIYPSRSKYNY
jgi:micrococcal nuclease